MGIKKKGIGSFFSNVSPIQWMLIITALSFFLRLHYLNAGIFHYDDIVIAQGMEKMFHEGGFVPATNGRYGTMAISYFFYYPYAFFTGNSAEMIPAFTAVVFSSFAILVFMLLIKKLFQNNFFTYTAGIFFSLTPIHLSQSTIGKEHSMSIFFLLFGLLFLFYYEKHQHWKFLSLSSLVFSIALSIRESTMVLLPLFFVYGIWKIFKVNKDHNLQKEDSATIQRKRQLWIHLAALFLPFLLISAFLLQQYLFSMIYGATIRPDKNPIIGTIFKGIYTKQLPKTFADLSQTLTLLGIILVIPGFFLAFRQYKKRKDWLILLSCWALLIFYFGNLNIYKTRFLIELLPPFIIFMTISLAYLYTKKNCLRYLVYSLSQYSWFSVFTLS